MDLGDTRRAQYSLKELKKLMAKSTDVVNWYPHWDAIGATVRGPFNRWFTIEEVHITYKDNVASPLDDAKYAAACMNSVPHLIKRIEELEEKIADSKYTNYIRKLHE